MSVMELGFCMVPSLLLKAQRRLKITPAQLAVLMHLADISWRAEQNPIPSKALLAERLSVGERQIQRHIAALEKMGYVKRIARTSYHKGKISNEYELSGLVKRLKEIAPEFKDAEEKRKALRRSVSRPGLRRRNVASE
jgi:DNA-binding transcriptional ArsR family regulator